MSGVGFFELVILFMIGLVVLGPKRLPKVASQLGSWVGQARRMTRQLKRQLEEELNVDEELRDLKTMGEELKSDLTIGPAAAHIPRDDDTYSPLHDRPETATGNVGVSHADPIDNQDEGDDRATAENEEAEEADEAAEEKKQA